MRLDDHFCIYHEVFSFEDHGLGVEEEILFSEPGLFLEIHGAGMTAVSETTMVNNDIQNLLEFIRVLVGGDPHGQGVGEVVTVDAGGPHDYHEERRGPET